MKLHFSIILMLGRYTIRACSYSHQRNFFISVFKRSFQVSRSNEITGSLLKRYIDNGEFEVARQKFETIKTEKPSSFICSSILDGYINLGRYDEAKKEFYYLLETNKNNLGEYHYNSILRGMIEEGNVDGIYEMLNLMKDHSIIVNTILFNKILLYFLKTQKNVKKAAEIYLNPIGEVKLNVITHTIMIDGFAKAGDSETAVKLFESIKVNTELDFISYCALISTLTKINRVKQAIDYIEELREKKLIENFVNNRKKNIFDVNVKKQFVPNVVTYSILVHAYISDGDFDLVDATLKEMESLCFKPDIFTFCILIKGYLKHGKLALSYQCFDDMINVHNIPPHPYVYSIFVNEHFKLHFKQRAYYFYDQALATNCLNVSLFSVMIRNMLNTEKDSTKAKRYLGEMKIRNINFDEVNFKLVTSDFLKFGELDEAIKIFEDCLDVNILPKDAIFPPFVEMLVARGHFEEGLRYIFKMEDLNLPISDRIASLKYALQHTDTTTTKEI